MGLLLLLFSCTPSDEVRISGKFENLMQADLYIYSSTGAMEDIDTINLREGKFDWRNPLTSEAVFHIVFPNMSEQVVFANPGEHIKLKGDGNQLKAIEISGNEANEEYTKFRLEHLSAPKDTLMAHMREYVKAHRETSEGIFMQRLITMNHTRLTTLRKGGKLPDIILPPDGFGGKQDTFKLSETSKEKSTLLVFWAGWKSESHGLNYYIKKALKERSKDLQAISISLDTDTTLYRLMCRQDSITWTTRCYRMSWETPIVQQFGIRTVPLIIIADKNRKILSIGTKWEEGKGTLPPPSL